MIKIFLKIVQNSNALSKKIAFITISSFCFLITTDSILAQETTLAWKVHDVNNVRQVITNNGALNAAEPFDRIYNYPYSINCEFPLNSNEEHIYLAGIWIGAINSEGDTLVSVTRTHFTPDEFYATSADWDTVWVVEKDDTIDIPYWPGYTAFSDQDFVCRYSDYNFLDIYNHHPLNLDVIQRSYAWSSSPQDEFIILNYDVIPVHAAINDVYISYWQQGGVGNNEIAGNYWADEYTRFYPNYQMGVTEDAPGGNDGTAYSPIGVKVISPKDSSLNWAYQHYTHADLDNINRDPARYRNMSNGNIMPDILTPDRSHWTISFGPFEKVEVGDTLHFSLAIILGEGLDGLLVNAQYVDYFTSGGAVDLLPELKISDLKTNYINDDTLMYKVTAVNIGNTYVNFDSLNALYEDNVTIHACFSSDEIFNNEGDIDAGNLILSGILQPGESITDSNKVPLPDDPSLTPYLIVMVDFGNVVDEIIETNNTNIVQFYSPVEILSPEEEQSFLALKDTIGSWQGIYISLQSKMDDPNIAYAWSADHGDWRWTNETSFYITPDKFNEPYYGQHTINVTWGVDQEIMDPFGDSVRINFIEPKFDRKILIIDETIENRFPLPNKPGDNEIDSLYASIFGTKHCWDFEKLGMPPLDTLGRYQLIIWHGDNPYSSSYDIHKFPEYTDLISNYLDTGGDLILSGWRMLTSFISSEPLPLIFQKGSFVGDYLHIEMIDETVLYGDFIGSEGINPFSDIEVDSSKISQFPYIGKLAQVNLMINVNMKADTIFTYQNEDDSSFPGYRGKVCAVKYEGPNYQTVTIGFPLYFLKEEDARQFANQILVSLGYDPNAIELNLSKFPGELKLEQNYPNPFNPATTITYCLPTAGVVELTIYNILGEKVQTLLNLYQPGGYHKIIWDGMNAQGIKAPSGIYIYRLRSGQSIISKKMILIK